MKRVLQFLRVTDENGDFSISNMVAFASSIPILMAAVHSVIQPTIASAQNHDWVAVAGSAIGFLVYGAKRWKQRSAQGAEIVDQVMAAYDLAQARIADLEKQLSALKEK